MERRRVSSAENIRQSDAMTSLFAGRKMDSEDLGRHIVEAL